VSRYKKCWRHFDTKPEYILRQTCGAFVQSAAALRGNMPRFPAFFAFRQNWPVLLKINMNSSLHGFVGRPVFVRIWR